MDFDLVIKGKDEATYKKTLNRNGIEVEVKVSMLRESLVAKTVIKKVREESTTTVGIRVYIANGATKLVTVAGATASHLVGYERSYRTLNVSAAPPGTIYNANLNTKTFAISLAKKIMEAAIHEKSHVGRPKLAKTLDLLKKVNKKFAIDMNIRKMRVIGLEPLSNSKRSKSLCKTKLWTTDSSPSVDIADSE